MERKKFSHAVMFTAYEMLAEAVVALNLPETTISLLPSSTPHKPQGPPLIDYYYILIEIGNETMRAVFDSPTVGVIWDCHGQKWAGIRNARGYERFALDEPGFGKLVPFVTDLVCMIWRRAINATKYPKGVGPPSSTGKLAGS